ncbi:MAG: flagellar filament capping protein FliD [Burkholderiales bacterium]
MATVSGASQGIIDVAGIVSQLMTIEQRPLSNLARKEAGIQSKVSAYGSVKGALTSFQSSFSNLNNLATYQSVKATSSDEAHVKVSAGPTAPAGSHSIRVTNLASSHAIASSNFSSTGAIVGTGTLTFQKGTSSGGAFTSNPAFPTKSVTIGAAQNTITGIRDAVNGAGIGVTASIVNDGTGYRLVFSSTDGAANSLKVTVEDADASNTNAAGLSALAYDPVAAVGNGKNLTEMRGAQDAIAIIDGITVTNPSSVITSAIDGLTFTANATSSTTATVNITIDNGGIKSGIEAFVKSYNELIKQIKDLTSFDATTKQAGPLNGDATLRILQSEMRTLVTGKFGVAGSLQTLSDIGMALNKDGVLVLDNAKLQKQLDIDRGAVAQLFAKSGQATDSRVSFVKAIDKTPVGTYEVTITQAATQGTLAGNQAAALTITTGVNDMLSLTIDGTQATILLPARTYSSTAELAADLQSRIAGIGTLSAAGVGVTIANAANLLTITSTGYGNASTLVAGGNAASALLGNAPITTAGLDVTGSIGDTTAVGKGQLLVGTGKANGLELRINASVTGSLGTVKYFEGITSKLDARITELTGAKGVLKARTDGYEAAIKAVGKLMTEYGDRLTKIEARYRRQYSALDATLGKMNTTSNYLRQQLASIAANTARK